MRAAIDAAGRLVIPKPLREAVGLGPGEVDVSVSGADLVITGIGGGLVERDGELSLVSTGRPVTPDQIRRARLADQR
jgi:AbrB family looped-hinge helix DNA binding protein